MVSLGSARSPFHAQNKGFRDRNQQVSSGTNRYSNRYSGGMMTDQKEARRGWFADWDNEATTDYGWQPCLETGQGHIPSFEVWFKTKAECEEWIAGNIIGADWLPGDPTEIRPIPPGDGRA